MRLTPLAAGLPADRALRRPRDPGAGHAAAASPPASAPTRASSARRRTPSPRWPPPRPRPGSTATPRCTTSRPPSPPTTACGRRTSSSARASTACSATSSACWSREGTPVVTSAGAYPTFAYHVTGFGGRLLTVPYRDDAEDPEALLLAARRAGAPLVYLANPDNPMGSWHPRRPHRRDGRPPARRRRPLPRRGLCRLRAGRTPSRRSTRRAPGHPHAHLLQGARHRRGPRRLRHRPPRPRSPPSTASATTSASAASPRPARWPRSPTRTGSPRSSPRSRPPAPGSPTIAEANGLRALPSATNFVTIDCGRDGAFARAVLNGLVARGIFVRMPFVAPQDRCIRVTAGRPADLAAFAAALPEALAAARMKGRAAAWRLLGSCRATAMTSPCLSIRVEIYKSIYDMGRSTP